MAEENEGRPEIWNCSQPCPSPSDNICANTSDKGSRNSAANK